MTTLARERRTAFEAIIQDSDIYHYALSHLENLGQGQFAEQMVKDLAASLAAASLSRSERVIPGIEAAMFGDRPVTQEDLDPEAEALKAFESAMHLPGNWQWYPAKSTDAAVWKGLREFIVKVYRTEGVKSFEEYFTWSIQPYSRGAMTALAIKQNPGNFEASWAAFKASEMFTKKTDEVRGEYRPGRISA